MWTAAGCGSVEIDPSALDGRTAEALTYDEPLEVELGIAPAAGKEAGHGAD